jgi:hypothetical protein
MILFFFKDTPFLYNNSGFKLKILCFQLETTNDFPKLAFSFFFLLSFDFGLSFFPPKSSYLNHFCKQKKRIKV